MTKFLRVIINERYLFLTGICKVTGNMFATSPVRHEDFKDFENGTHAQEAFFYLPPEEREFIISGTSPEGWKQLTGEVGPLNK